MRGLEGVPGLPGAPQEEAGLTRTLEMSHVGGATCRTPPIPRRGLEGVPGRPGAPQDEAGLTRKFETSHVGGATGRTPPIPRSALEKDPRPGPLFEGNPVGEGTTRRGTATPVHRRQSPAGSTHSSTSGLRPPEQLERQAGFPSSDKTRPDSPVPTLQGP